MRQVLAALLLTISALHSSAAQAAWISATVNRIQLASDGRLIVFINATHQCGSDRLDFYPTSAPPIKMLLAALLIYETKREPVQFHVDSCSGAIGMFSIIESSIKY